MGARIHRQPEINRIGMWELEPGQIGEIVGGENARPNELGVLVQRAMGGEWHFIIGGVGSFDLDGEDRYVRIVQPGELIEVT